MMDKTTKEQLEKEQAALIKKRRKLEFGCWMLGIAAVVVIILKFKAIVIDLEPSRTLLDPRLIGGIVLTPFILYGFRRRYRKAAADQQAIEAQLAAIPPEND